MTITISLEKLQFRAHHGVMEQERIVGGDFMVDVTMDVTAAEEAVENDNLAGTVNYAEAYEAVKDEMHRPSRLIEHVAGRIGKRLLNDFAQVERVTVHVVKSNPPMGALCAGAGITLTLSR